MNKPPSGLPPTVAAQPLRADLLLGSFVHGPTTLPLFDIIMPASGTAPASPEESTYHPLPEIVHTFRPEQKLPVTALSGLFALAVLAPWPILLFLVCAIHIISS
jgi:oligosaccharyltransferase complex subunit delta (ribophorin II)